MASKAYEIFECLDIEQKRKLINFVFSNLQLRGVSLKYDLNPPFDLMIYYTTYSEWLGLLNTLRTQKFEFVFNKAEFVSLSNSISY